MKSKITFIFIYLFILGYSVNSQDKPRHTKKLYQSPEGKLYIQKELPVYLRLSTSPDEDAESFLLQSEDSEAYTNPMYFDTEGYNTFRSPSKVDTVTKKIVYPVEDVIFEVYADGISPVSKIKYEKSTPVSIDSVIHLKGNTKIVISATDQQSGVDNIYFSLNGKPYNKLTDTIQFNDELLHILKYYAVDHVGNDEDIHVKYIKLDASAPVTSLKIETDSFENVVSARSKLVLQTKDIGVGASHIHYSIDAGTEHIYKYPIQARYLSQGEHSISYYAVDRVGNQEKVKTFNFYVDKTPPSLVEEVVGKTFVANGQEFTSGRSKLKLTAFDNKAGVKEIYYSVNGEEYQLYDRPFFLKIRSGGEIVIKTYAIDNVNNKVEIVEEASRISVPYIDLSGPTLANVFLGPTYISRDTLFISGKTKISLSGRDEEAGLRKIEFVLDNEGFKDYSQPFTVEQEGYHSIIYTGYDYVDNTNKKDLEFVVDTTGPEIFHRFSIKPIDRKKIDGEEYDVYPAHVVIFLSSTDQRVGYDKMYYSLNEESKKLYTGLIKGFTSDKAYTLKVTGMDKLENETSDIVKFFIE